MTEDVQRASVSPSSVQVAPEIRLLTAFIDAYLAHPLAGAAAEASFESARLRLIAAADGRLSPADRYLQPTVSAELRAVFGLSGELVVDRVLGSWAESGAFVIGLAGLTPRECEVMLAALRGLRCWEIARGMQPTKRTGMPPAVASVEVWLCDGRKKLRALFGVVKGPP